MRSPAGFRTALALAAAALILSPALVLAVRDLGLEADAARAAARAAGGGVGEAGTAAEGKFKPFENIGGGGTAGEGDGKVPEVEEDEFGGAKVLIRELAKGEACLEPEVPRVRQRTNASCLIRLIEPLDEPVTHFMIGELFPITVDIECSEKGWRNTEGFSGTMHIDHATWFNFTVDKALVVSNVTRVHLPVEVTQWFHSNIVVKLRDAPHVHLSGRIRTLHLRQKHRLNIVLWERPAFGDYYSTSAAADLPIFLRAHPLRERNLTLISPEHGALVPQGDQIDVRAALHLGTVPPGVIQVSLWQGWNKAVRLFPEWQLPKLGSSDPAILHVTVAFIPMPGMFPIRLELSCARRGIIGSLYMHVEVISTFHERKHVLSVHYPEPDPLGRNTTGWRGEHIPPPIPEPPPKEEMEPYHDPLEHTRFCSRRHATYAGGSLQEWHQHLGDEALRIEYPLTPASVVIDLGGHKGTWARQIARTYGCKVHVFEPLARFRSKSEEMSRELPSVSHYPFAIVGTAPQDTGVMAVRGASSHLLPTSSVKEGAEKQEEVQVREIAWALQHLSLTEAGVALLKLNVEGAEVGILEALVKSGDVRRVQDIQVQFHETTMQTAVHVEGVRASLNATHCLTYSFPFIWENWSRR